MRSFKYYFSLAALFFSVSLLAQTKAMWPDAEYSQDIPTVESVLGYSIGERISSHADMLKYFEALQEAAPQRMVINHYAKTWQNRDLIYAVISSPENMAKLEEHQANMQRLSDPRTTSKADAQSIIDGMPSSVWLGYSVHGNEISGTDSAMITAYHLLASTNQPVVDKVLANTLIFIDPLQNPDGRERFTSRYYATVGMEHSPDRFSAEHNEPWPNGRSNHYLFDMNRDWLAVTQPETKGRIKTMLHYRPLVVIDLHEMGGDSGYYFAPAARPINPFMTPEQLENIALVGKKNADYFDEFGFDYFTREIFDAFYPGYGDSWPKFYGASASTYEVGSSRGEIFRRANGELYTYWDSVQRHFVASISTIEATSDNREKLLRDYYEYQVSAIDAGRDADERTYIIPTQKDRGTAHRLATLLAEHGVEVTQAQESFKLCGTDYQAGAYIVDSAQPRGRYVSTVMTQQVDIAQDFIDEQERRRARKLRDEIYDVTAWSLPLMFNVDVDTCDRATKVDAAVVNADTPLEGNLTNPDAKVAYIAPWGDAASTRLLTSLLRNNVKLKSASKPFVIDQKRYPSGSLIIETARNKDIDLVSIMADLTATTGAIVDGVDSSWVSEGPNFGSGNVVDVKAPNIAMAWDQPTSSLSAGNTRFVIERSLGYPVTAIRAGMLGSADLSRYQVLILPSGNYAASKSTISNIQEWVKDGGVLITLGRATSFAASSDAGLLALKRELALKEDEAEKPSEEDEVPAIKLTSKADYFNAIENHKESPDSVAGVLARVDIDTEHWLAAGVDSSVFGLVSGRDIFQPIKLADGANIGWYSDQESLLASGYLWQENLEQMPFKAFMVQQDMGRGMVIGFTQDIGVRAYLDGLNILLANSVFLAPAHTRTLH
ncbi:peptidase M14 [Glaciecola sp. XM2]|uniref:M14 family metallopeptidase n=1 Tax=Glaciecola sp. XM2 TaxID=1914931 RepID=UPI001BDDD78C|nr:M14 family metallopeptidase [Glaciecola sp. XM2]MBT1451519.1 peptidase M14 [Glaciecola sp. XM2]